MRQAQTNGQRLAIFAEEAGERGLSRGDIVARTAWLYETLDLAAAEAIAAQTIR
ncbi:MAG: hypothetical protein WKF84_15540 [Pyrinomonadaceae bacterium]